MDDDQKAVIVAAINLALARKKLSPEGYAPNSVWDLIEARENQLMATIEQWVGLKNGSLGRQNS